MLSITAAISLCGSERLADEVDRNDVQLRALAAYYKLLVSSDPDMRRYVSQASRDPAVFRETVRADVLQRTHIDESDLTEKLLQSYVDLETMSMNFMRTGKTKLTERIFWAWWDDDRIVFESKLVPAMIAVYSFPQQSSLAVEVLLQRAQTLRTFAYARHDAFAEISSRYMAQVFTAYLQDDRTEALTAYVRHCHLLIDAMRFQQGGNISEALALSLKIMSKMSAESRDQHLKKLAVYVVEHCTKKQQNFFTQSCLQYDLIVFSAAEK